MSHKTTYGWQIEKQEYFNWKCLICGQIAQSPMHVAMQWLVEYGPNLDLDGSTKWVKCGKCFSPYHITYLQSAYWALSLYVFRLLAVIFPYFVAHLFIFISLLFSSDVMGGDNKKKRRQWSPKGSAKPRIVRASHCNKDVNQWKEPIMK